MKLAIQRVKFTLESSFRIFLYGSERFSRLLEKCFSRRSQHLLVALSAYEVEGLNRLGNPLCAPIFEVLEMPAVLHFTLIDKSEMSGALLRLKFRWRPGDQIDEAIPEKIGIRFDGCPR